MNFSYEKIQPCIAAGWVALLVIVVALLTSNSFCEKIALISYNTYSIFRGTEGQLVVLRASKNTTNSLLLLLPNKANFEVRFVRHEVLG